MTDKIRIYFMGSGKIAVPVLRALTASERIELLGIGTQTDQPAGRKKQLRPTPVGQFAAENKLPADKIEAVKDPAFTAEMRSLGPDFIVVVSFGQILRQELLDIPKYCCLNVHASVLPKYRGASPISSVILDGTAETGVTFMKMDKGLDTGDIYEIFKIPLQGNESADSLEQQLGELAAENIVGVLERIQAGQSVPEAQNETEASLTRKVSKNDGQIDWSMSAIKIEAMVRAYHPWPGAYFNLTGRQGQIRIIITGARRVNAGGEAGEILQADKKGLIVACGQGALEITKLIPQGKKEMSGPAFLNGHSLERGTKI
jgi:methionyl-tRNA formyltransferase